MKKFLLLFLTAFSVIAIAQSDPNIKWLHPSPQGQDLLWMKMWDNNNWYFTGRYGAFMKTTDGGQTWQTNNKAGWPNTTYPNTLTNWDANEAWFFDQNNGIICPGNSSGILKTTNGGESFDTLRILEGGSAGKHIYGIHFVNASLGFICGSSAYKIFKTTDGGNTWNQLPNLDAVVYNDVYAVNELNITACSEGGKVYKTTNGGTNWDIIQLPTLQPLFDLEFINADTGYVSGGVGFFKSTTDGGSTWTGGTNTPTATTNWKVKVVNNEVYVAGDYTNLFKSMDDGVSWTTLSITVPGNYTGFNHCLDIVGSTVVTAGRYGNVYKSTNNGSNFTKLSQRVTDGSFFRSIYVNNTSGKIISAGRWMDIPGSIIYSDDAGSTWQASPYTTPQANMLNRLLMFDDNNGYFAGDGGFFAKTTDGGINLTTLSIPFSGGKRLYNMDFINQSEGWVVGGLIPGGTTIVAKTTDGGLTWTEQTPAGLGGLILSVDFVDANIGYFSHSAIYKTTNGGSTWNPIVIPGAGANLREVKAFNANNVYVISGDGTAAGGKLFKTMDGGTSWSEITLPLGMDISGQNWLDMNNGFLTSTLGLVLLTNNGGATWTLMNTGGWTAYGGKMISPACFYITAGEGQIFRYGTPPAPTTFPLTVNVSNGWNMVSIPGLLPTNQNVTSWWPGKDPAAGVFKFQNGYQSVETAVPGTGYWMKNLTAQTYNTGDEWPAGGIQFVSHDPITAISGWNLFGGYEQSVPAAGLTTTPSGLISGSVYKYSGGYQVTATIDPGYGYWIKLTGAGSINIPSGTTGPLKSDLTAATKDFGRIIITDNNQNSYTLYAANGETDLTQFELPPLPPQGMFDVRYSSQRQAEKLSSSQVIELTGVKYPIRIKAEGTGITVSDETGKEITRLKAGEEFKLNTEVNKLYVKENIVPLVYSLEQNYPNPFNPSTLIEFSLPESAANVKLSIYNALGEKVAELVNTTLAAGKYSYQWNASDVATGMYVYELRADKFVSVKKMMLLK